jgi:5-methyltetrahydrofolate--homocysteine methyltransferase
MEVLQDAIVDLRYNEIGKIVKTALDSGMKPLDVLGELRAGLTLVGDRYQSGEFFLSHLFLAAETMKSALEVLKPFLIGGEEQASKGSVVIGSIEGDIHDFGKVIVSSFLIAAGLNVVDLGVDVPVKRFVDEAERVGADVIGISALLSTTQPSCQKIVEELERRGIRDMYKVIVGGTGVVPDTAIMEYGVDAGVNDGVEGVKIITRWLEEGDEGLET